MHRPKKERMTKKRSYLEYSSFLHTPGVDSVLWMKDLGAGRQQCEMF